MMAITGLVVVAKFILAGIVGVRLLRLPGPQLVSPERLLGIYFLVNVTAGGLLVALSYAAWASLGSVESPVWLSTAHGTGNWMMAIGFSCLLYFTQRTFHAQATWAKLLAPAAVLVVTLSLVGRTYFEGFAITLQPSLYHWIAYWVRMLALGWMATSSFMYWRQMKRRQSLGLAEPLLVNRFILWTVFAGGTMLTALAEPVARFIYRMTTGDAGASAEAIQTVGGSVIQTTLLVTAVFGLVTITALFLTFFPTKGYQRWVTGQAAN